jgi:NADPH:quinone reductase
LGFALPLPWISYLCLRRICHLIVTPHLTRERIPMRALLSTRVGGPKTLVLADVPEPVPKDDEVLIKVKACGVNFPDTLMIEDKYQFRPERPFSPGGEVAGVVESVGKDVSRIRTGDRVIGWRIWGGMAEKVAAKAVNCVRIPDQMPFDEASALIVTYGTSYYALQNRANLLSGETLIVLGAAGGVGLAAVELGKALGAHVIAAASSEEKVAFAQDHGADSGIVYPRGPFEKEQLRGLSALFKQACPDGANVIYDAVGGDYAEAALRCIAREGRFLVVGFPAGIPKLPLNLVLLKSCQIVGVFWADWVENYPAEFGASVRELLQFYSQGAIKPVISRRFPLDEGGTAIELLAARSATGKVVVMVD